MNDIVIIITAAYILDLFLGDINRLPHPVKIIGKVIKLLELPVRKITKNQRLAGIIFACVIIAFSGFIPFFILREMRAFNNYAGLLFSILLAYTTISVKGLKDETLKVYYGLKKNDLSEARKSLSLVVGRDTVNLDKRGIINAAVETIAENTNDGIIAPLFYLILGGPVLALMYKAVNTLDSMVGYKNDEYLYFGWFSAKLDDVVNFIPARICGLLIFFASLILNKGFGNSFKIMLRDGRKHTSPNSGITESAMAGALGIRLGGNSFYNGVLSVKPYLGEEIRKTGTGHIKEALAISFISSVLMAVIGITFKWMV